MGHLKHVINTNRGGIGTFERIQNLCSRIGGGGGEVFVSATLRELYPPGKRPGTHFTGGCVGCGAGLDGCGKYHVQLGLNLGPANT